MPMASSDEHDASDGSEKKEPIHLTIPPRMLAVPATAFIVGAAIGIMRGGRTASLRFLAENAHRPPTTVQGWYFYNKTKNYKVMLGALKGAGAEAGKLTALGVTYVGLEEGMERVGWGQGKHMGAAVGSAVLFATVYRLPVTMARRAVVLGVVMGGAMSGLEYVGKRRPAGGPTEQ
ncbi:hypothetical protein BJ912DRAFT_1052242 [Pholiota molesta]|nr:hypothetical protein BJ912DRAFT_1052242 [Pholiota molesta]